MAALAFSVISCHYKDGVTEIAFDIYLEVRITHVQYLQVYSFHAPVPRMELLSDDTFHYFDVDRQ